MLSLKVMKVTTKKPKQHIFKNLLPFIMKKEKQKGKGEV